MVNFKNIGKWFAGSVAVIGFSLGGIYYAVNRLSSSINQAQVSERAGNLEKAVEEYTNVIRKQPENPRGYRERGDAEQRRENIEEAVDDYRKVVELGEERDVPNITNIEQIVNSSKINKKPPKVLEEEDNVALSFYNSAIQKIAGGDLGGALKDLDKALKEDAEFIEAYMERGSVKFRLKDYTGAFADFDDAVGLDPNNPLAYNNRGLSLYFYYKENNLPDLSTIRLIAIGDISVAIDLDPYIANFYENRGNLEYEEGVYRYEDGFFIGDIWKWAEYDYKMVAYFNGDRGKGVENGDLYCKLGRIIAGIVDESKEYRNSSLVGQCLDYKNACIEYHKLGLTNSFPLYLCPVNQ